jgi:hypothetical protein
MQRIIRTFKFETQLTKLIVNSWNPCLIIENSLLRTSIKEKGNEHKIYWI